MPAQRAGCVPAMPAKIAYLSCVLPQNFAPAAHLGLLVPAQIQLALRTEARHPQQSHPGRGNKDPCSAQSQLDLSRHKEAKSADGANFCGKTHDKCAILAGTAGTQPALCAGTTKRQFMIFRIYFGMALTPYHLGCFGTPPPK